MVTHWSPTDYVIASQSQCYSLLSTRLSGCVLHRCYWPRWLTRRCCVLPRMALLCATVQPTLSMIKIICRYEKTTREKPFIGSNCLLQLWLECPLQLDGGFLWTLPCFRLLAGRGRNVKQMSCSWQLYQFMEKLSKGVFRKSGNKD